ncbi:TonB-dependent receptor [Sphingobium sp. H39-3-25]|uniref:TonB-dependent receptor plug domain-containing protein n=1 Tax=Sphingobium arseniciresistens TaxID=3030834 RepID=UPI0023B8F84B|nr:TonB-dependent receptor [Sphingobium arseniciresistens]
MCAVSIWALASSVSAHAQTSQVPDNSSAASVAQQVTTQPEAAPATPLADIVVTGSRIGRAGFQAPTPVTVLNTDDLIKKQPSSLADALYQLPAFQNSVNGNQQQFSQANRQRTGNYLNLRALGTQRVLVLQDGQRLPPTGTNGGIDASLVPQLLTQRIDIVTGGASATYGSDAVSGVVNFIINKRFEGLKAQAQAGVASGGYQGSYRLGVAGGFSALNDRLHVIASAERYHSDEVLKTSIPSIAEGWGLVGLGTAADPIRYINGVRYSTVSNGGYIINGPLAGRQFGADGSVVPFDRGQPIPAPGIAGQQRFGDGGFFGQGCCTITPSQTQNQLFGRAEYEFNDTISVFASGGYNFSTNSDHSSVFYRPVSTIYAGNAYLSPSVAASLGNTASFNIGKIDNRYSPRVDQKSDSLVINTGINGTIGKLKWQIGYTHGWTAFQSSSGDQLNQNFYAAADAVRDGSGNIVCRVTLTNPGLYPGCVPINLFGPESITPEAAAYVYGVSTYRAVNKLDSGEVSISGELFDGWAGPISFAVGGEYRRQTLNQTSNSDPSIPTSFTGLRGVQSNASLKFRNVNQGIAKGAYTIKEVFGELNVPVVKNSVVGSLELNGAARYTDYSTSGSVTTWKIGGLYDPIPGVRFRATLSRDIRAPTLYELFAGQTSNGLAVADQLTSQSGVVPQISGGNPALTPEVARSFTGGVILTPSFLPGLNFSADYYKIKIKDAIATPFTAFQVLSLCAASGYTSPLCAQVVRPLGATNTSAANFPTAILTSNQNLSVLDISGIDFELRYSRPVAGGRLSGSALATRAIRFKQATAPGQPVQDYVGTADYADAQFPVPLPKWRGTFSLAYENGPVSVSAQERFVGSYKRSKLLNYAVNDIGSVWYTDASITFRVPGFSSKGEIEFFGTANNLFNRKAPLIPVSGTPGLTVPTIRNTYDVIGRYITIGARIKM